VKWAVRCALVVTLALQTEFALGSYVTSWLMRNTKLANGEVAFAYPEKFWQTFRYIYAKIHAASIFRGLVNGGSIGDASFYGGRDLPLRYSSTRS
jgi:hypothetical protein